MSKKWKKLSGFEELLGKKNDDQNRDDNSLDPGKEKPKRSKNKKDHRSSSVVYSTDPNYSSEIENEEDTVATSEQDLRVQLERKNRGGKAVTLIAGFIGNDDDLKELGKKLKAKCGVGGSAKDGEIIIQGDHRDKIVSLLEKDGFRVKRIN